MQRSFLTRSIETFYGAGVDANLFRPFGVDAKAGLGLPANLVLCLRRLDHILTVALLLRPDAQRLKIGGFEFERLTAKVEEQTHEIRQLQQTVNTTVNVGSDLINQVRNGFRQTKDILDRVRAFLPQTAEIQEQLTAVDQLEQRAASESWPDLFAGIMTMHALIDTAASASAASLLRTSEAADTAENEARAETAESVISDYL